MGDEASIRGGVGPADMKVALVGGALVVAPFVVVWLLDALDWFPLDRMGLALPMYLLGFMLMSLWHSAHRRLQRSISVGLAMVALAMGAAIVWDNSQAARREARTTVAISEICRDFEGQACRRLVEAYPGRLCRLGLTPPARCEAALRRDAGAQ